MKNFIKKVFSFSFFLLTLWMSLQVQAAPKPELTSIYTIPQSKIKPTSTPIPTLTPKMVNWKGNGTNNGYCSELNYDSTVDKGKQQWLFILTSPYSKTVKGTYTLTANFDPDGIKTIDGVRMGNGSVHFTLLTSIGAKLLEAQATNGTANSVLTVSHCEYNLDPLEVSKTAETYYKRTWDWTINKSVNNDDLGQLDPGDIATASYTVKVSAISNDSDWNVSGEIKIKNPDVNGVSAVIESIEDLLDKFGKVDIDCQDAEFPYILNAGDTLTCTYSQNVENTEDFLNTVEVTTSNLVPGNTTTAEVVWGDPKKVDECANVSDTNTKGPNEEVCAGNLDENSEKTYTYDLTFGKDAGADITLGCGSNTFDNTASFETADSKTYDESSVAVFSIVNCPIATKDYWCSPGFWKNAKFDVSQYVKDNGSDPNFSMDYVYSTIPSSLNPAGLKSGDPNTAKLEDVISKPNVYGGPATNSVADYIAYLLGWTGNQNTKPEACPVDAHGNWLDK